MKCFQKNNVEMQADVFEAIENLNKWKPIYLAILKNVKDKEQALKALKYLIEIEKKM